MKLYIKQKLFSIKQDFNIYNDKGQEVYEVKGELLSWGRKLHLIDAQSKEEVAFLKQKVLSLFVHMDVFVDGDHMTAIKQKFSLFKPKFVINDLDWTIEGNIWQHDFTIRNAKGRTIAKFHKKFLSWSDTFEIDIVDDEADPILALAVILAVDLAKDISESN